MARATLWKHRKFRRLEMALKSKCLAAGVLECLWSCGYESGDDLIGSPDEIERACGWHGKRGVLCAVLAEIGWIDDSPQGYRIHDLYDHAPEYVKKRRTREAKRRTSDRTLTGQRPDTDRPLTGQKPDTDPHSPLPYPYPSPLPHDPPATGRSPDPAREASGGGSQAPLSEQPNGNGDGPGSPEPEEPLDLGKLVAGVFAGKRPREPVDEEAQREKLRRQAVAITAPGGAL